MRNLKVVDLLLLAAIFALSMQLVANQFRMFNKYSNRGYNTSANLISITTTPSEFFCLRACNVLYRCIIAVVRSQNNTYTCRLYRGFMGLYNMNNWLTSELGSNLYFRIPQQYGSLTLPTKKIFNDVADIGRYFQANLTCASGSVMSLQYSCPSQGVNAVPFLVKIFFDANKKVSLNYQFSTNGSFTTAIDYTVWNPQTTYTFSIEFLILSGYYQVFVYYTIFKDYD